MKTKHTQSRKKRPATLPFKNTRKQENYLQYIHERILSGTFPTCEELALELKVSTKSICRDIKILKVVKKMPIKYSRTAGQEGYYYDKDANVAQKIGRTFNEREITSLFIADRALAKHFSPLPRQQKPAVGFEKISQLLDPQTRQLLDDLQDTVFFRPFAPEEVNMDTFFTVAEAVRERHTIHFDYQKHLAVAPEPKRVRPYCFICAANSWYVIGLDVVKDEMRTYMLSRMTNPVMTEFTFPKPKFNVDTFLKTALIVLVGDPDELYEVVLEFDSWASPYILNRKIMATQKLEKLDGNRVRLTLYVSALEEVDAWVAYWRLHAKVIAPQVLRDRFANYGLGLVREYVNDAESLKKLKQVIDERLAGLERQAPGAGNVVKTFEATAT